MKYHQGWRKGKHCRNTTIWIAPELAEILEELASQENASLGLTVNTLLAMQLGVKLYEPKREHRKNSIEGGAQIILFEPRAVASMRRRKNFY